MGTANATTAGTVQASHPARDIWDRIGRWLSLVLTFGLALLWAVHPLQVESVAWISERKNVLSAVFFFAAFLGWLRWHGRWNAGRYAALLLLYALALLSKMNTVVLPALCLAHEALLQHRLRRAEWLATLPLWGLGAAIVGINLAGNPIHAGGFHGGSAIVTWLSSSVVVFRYLFRPLARRLVDSLRPGGLLLYETFTIQQRKVPYGPDNPAFLLQPGELAGLFPGLEVLEHGEGWTPDPRPLALAHLLARKPPG